MAFLETWLVFEWRSEKVLKSFCPERLFRHTPTSNKNGLITLLAVVKFLAVVAAQVVGQKTSSLKDPG